MIYSPIFEAERILQDFKEELHELLVGKHTAVLEDQVRTLL